jgi:hypothetical protein
MNLLHAASWSPAAAGIAQEGRHFECLEALIGDLNVGARIHVTCFRVGQYFR